MLALYIYKYAVTGQLKGWYNIDLGSTFIPIPWFSRNIHMYNKTSPVQQPSWFSSIQTNVTKLRLEGTIVWSLLYKLRIQTILVIVYIENQTKMAAMWRPIDPLHQRQATVTRSYCLPRSPFWESKLHI